MSLSYKNHHFFYKCSYSYNPEKHSFKQFLAAFTQKKFKKKRIDDLEANVSLGALI